MATCDANEPCGGLDIQTYCDSIPDEQRWKLDKTLDFDHSGVQIHLDEIASAIDEWEESLATKLELTKVDVASIKEQHRDNLSLQV